MCDMCSKIIFHLSYTGNALFSSINSDGSIYDTLVHPLASNFSQPLKEASIAQQFMTVEEFI